MRAALFVMVLACSTVLPAYGQTVTAEKTAAQRCLTSTPDHSGLPEYPFDELKRAVKGVVKVELIFTVADKRPEAIVLESEGGPAFVDAVKEHARHLRVPCLQANEVPSRLRLDFVFRPDDRKVLGAAPPPPEELRRDKLFACMAHGSGAMSPPYPVAALRDGVAGRVVAQLSFDAPGKPPTVTVHARPFARVLAQAVEEFAQGYRLPCHEGPPAKAIVTYVYKIEGFPEYGMPNVTLPQFLKSVKDLKKLKLAMDTTTMSCPFDLQMGYYAPVLPNDVGQVGSYNGMRQPLIDWLKGATLDLPDRLANAVFADTFTVTVPCIKLDLKPKE